jgi:DNA primase
LYDNGFHCFCCGAHGDAIDWVMQTKGLRFPKAIHYLTGENVETDDSFGIESRISPSADRLRARCLRTRKPGQINPYWPFGR